MSNALFIFDGRQLCLMHATTETRVEDKHWT